MKRTVAAILMLGLSVGSSANVWAQQDLPTIQRTEKVEVSILGAVKSPGLYQVNTSEVGTKRGLFSLMAKAGFGDEIDLATPIEIHRGDITLKIDSFRQLYSQKANSLGSPSGVTLQNGDVVVVPTLVAPTAKIPSVPVRKKEISLAGFGKDVSTIQFPEEGALSLREVLSRANYVPSPSVNTIPKIIVFRDGQKLEVDLPSATNLPADFMLRDQDAVMLTTELLDSTIVGGNVASHGVYYFREKERPSIAQSLQLAGGVNGKNSDDLVSVIHIGNNGENTLSAQFNASATSTDPRWEQKIGDNDFVFVLEKNSVIPALYLRQKAAAK